MGATPLHERWQGGSLFVYTLRLTKVSGILLFQKSLLKGGEFQMKEARHKARSPPRRNVRSGQNSQRDRSDTWHSQEIRSKLWTTTCTTLML